MGKILKLITESTAGQVIATMLAYAIYAVLIGASLVPSLYLLSWSWREFLTPARPGGVAIFSLFCGAALFLYFVVGVFVLGLTIRLISHGIQPGRYSVYSPTMVRWLLYSGIYSIAGTTILAHVPLGFLGTAFFRLVGARIGRNVRINTWFLNDAYLLNIADDVVIGGKTDISCHTFEKGHLILRPVTVGRGTFIGQGCYISPGVTIGRDCVIGQFSLVRKGKIIPDKTVLSAIAGLPIRHAARIENSAGHLTETTGQEKIRGAKVN